MDIIVYGLMLCALALICTCLIFGTANTLNLVAYQLHRWAKAIHQARDRRHKETASLWVKELEG